MRLLQVTLPNFTAQILSGPYDHLTIPKLADECKRRGLARSAPRKSILIQRLEDDDARQLRAPSPGPGRDPDLYTTPELESASDDPHAASNHPEQVGAIVNKDRSVVERSIVAASPRPTSDLAVMPPLADSPNASPQPLSDDPSNKIAVSPQASYHTAYDDTTSPPPPKTPLSQQSARLLDSSHCYSHSSQSPSLWPSRDSTEGHTSPLESPTPHYTSQLRRQFHSANKKLHRLLMEQPKLASHAEDLHISSVRVLASARLTRRLDEYVQPALFPEVQDVEESDLKEHLKLTERVYEEKNAEMTALKHLIEHRQSRLRNINMALNEDQTGKVRVLSDKWRTVVSERNLVLEEAFNRGSIEVEGSADMAPGYKPVELGGHGMDTQVSRALQLEISWLEQDTAKWKEEIDRVWGFDMESQKEYKTRTVPLRKRYQPKIPTPHSGFLPIVTKNT